MDKSKSINIKRICKWILIAAIGCLLSVVYSYINKGGLHRETLVMFFILYMYMVVFLKFLIRLFK